ncbi:hypothetical protein [Streptomyces sp. V4I2]|uniref:hypothetical protein n=1 Tax=Streptomyces sp. V4I2 TaxID=3042280 RepID=UPI0027D7AEE5|nr:hypothetical protein [Streptomyces sp. V4I2]
MFVQVLPTALTPLGRALRQRHTTEAVIIGVTDTTPVAQALVLGRPTGGRMRAVGVSLPLTQQVRLAVASLLHASGEEMRELPGTVGGLPGAAPVRFWPVKPEVMVEIEVDQPSWSSATIATVRVFGGGAAT